jgi:hypothetical protein
VRFKRLATEVPGACGRGGGGGDSQLGEVVLGRGGRFSKPRTNPPTLGIHSTFAIAFRKQSPSLYCMNIRYQILAPSRWPPSNIQCLVQNQVKNGAELLGPAIAAKGEKRNVTAFNHVLSARGATKNLRALIQTQEMEGFPHSHILKSLRLLQSNCAKTCSTTATGK